jgi:hypothetical protein
MNRMRTIGSRKSSDTCDSDAYAPLPLQGRRCFGRKMSNSGDRARRRPHTRPLGFPDLCAARWSLPNGGLDTSTNRCCPEFRDHVDFDARAEWHLRHTDRAAGMDAALAEHLDK